MGCSVSEPMSVVEGIHGGGVEDCDVGSPWRGKNGTHEGERAVATMGDQLHTEG